MSDIDRIDYEKMALELVCDEFSSAPLHCRIATALQVARTAAAIAQREACANRLTNLKYCEPRAARIVRETKLITESEAV